MPSSLVARCEAFIELLAEDRRYRFEAYQFVEAGLAYAQNVLRHGRPAVVHGRPVCHEDGRPVRHVSGQELCWALRDLAHKQYGLLAKLVLANWGIHTTSDFGEIVYNLIRLGKLSKSERDRRTDFDGVYDFEQALLRDYAIHAIHKE